LNLGSLEFQWPGILVLLALIPFLVWLYFRSLKPPAQAVVLYPSLSLLSQAAKAGSSYRRHIAPLLYLLALILALLALARPFTPTLQADPRAGIVLAVDVSRSMQATDIYPSRFEAARSALRTLLRELPAGTRIGLVTFARTATTVVPLTTDRRRLLEAVDFIDLDLGTAIGEAILESISALPTLKERSDVTDPKSLANIILLTDGRSLAGANPLQAAQMAQKEQIRVHTIGIGKDYGGRPIPGLPEEYALAAAFDEQTLRSIASITGGEYTYVDSVRSLREAYRKLTRQMLWRVKYAETTGLFACLAALCLASSLIVSGLKRQVI
jgi:Ca-activated chloride channel homolog